MRAALLNSNRLNFDGNLSYSPIEAVVELVYFETTEAEEIAEHSRGCEILISKEHKLDDAAIERLPDEVRLICEAGTGVDNISFEAAAKRNIEVCNVADYSTSHVAQLAINFLLTMSSGWHRGPGSSSGISEVRGKILGVIGAGAIGEEVIRLARSHRMSVLVYNPSVRSWDDECVQQVELKKLLEESDFITLHCPLKGGTRHMIRAETICNMKQGAYLINTARGGLIDHGDLADALRSGRLAGVALDVQEPEPLPEDNSLRSMVNVILTNHIGWKSIESRNRLIAAVAEHIREYRLMQ
ncbi:D-2-hydroxyacid dehydrogenase [bacterium AH-315-J21]|nr:D-2-hydroxyacid dehydrogenase [bacterium AH-315-J21]